MQETSDLVHRCTPKDDDDLITTSANAAVFIHMLSVNVRVCVSEIKCIMKKHTWTNQQMRLKLTFMKLVPICFILRIRQD